MSVLPPAPFQNALKPSSRRIFLKQSMTPLYVVWPARAATWSLVLMTSAGVTSDAAGTPCSTQKQIIKHFDYTQIASDFDIPAAASRRDWNGYTFMVRDGTVKSGDWWRNNRKVWQRDTCLHKNTSEFTRCLLPAIAPAVSSCRGPSLPSSSASFFLVWA